MRLSFELVIRVFPLGSLLAKARQRPDHVKRVLQKIQQEGLRSTIDQVRARRQVGTADRYAP